MNLTQVPISMIDTVAGDAGKVLTSNGSTLSWTASSSIGVAAWVNFNGSGTVAIRGSSNVSSITDNNTGDYTVNFASAMPDANYSLVATRSIESVTTSALIIGIRTLAGLTVNSARIFTYYYDAASNGALDGAVMSVAIFR